MKVSVSITQSSETRTYKYKNINGKKVQVPVRPYILVSASVVVMIDDYRIENYVTKDILSNPGVVVRYVMHSIKTKQEFYDCDITGALKTIRSELKKHLKAWNK